MRYLKGVPEDFLRASFAYDPLSPSGLVRLNRFEKRVGQARHVYKLKEQKAFLSCIQMNKKRIQKFFYFGANGKTEIQARSEAEAWALVTLNENPKKPEITGSKNIRGYWVTVISYKNKRVMLRVHRIILLICTDIDIEGLQVDHIDNNRSNNNISNLRSGTNTQNSWNKKMLKTNKTGVKGLSNIAKNHSFHVQIIVNLKAYQKTFHYGANATEAHKEEVKAESIAWLRETRERLHGDYANHGDRGVIAS